MTPFSDEELAALVEIVSLDAAPSAKDGWRTTVEITAALNKTLPPEEALSRNTVHTRLHKRAEKGELEKIVYQQNAYWRTPRKEVE